MGLDILDARIITTQAGLVLDTFILLDSDGAPIRDPSRIEDITKRLTNAITHISKTEIPSRRMPRRLKHFHIPTDVTFSTDILNNRTVMELIAADRPGFLAYVGKALVSCDLRLQNAKISTLGERVEDVFFLTDQNNQPLSEPSIFECLKTNIKKYLDDDRE